MAQARSSGQRTAKKNIKNIPYGQAHIYSTFNNTIISMTDQSGNVIAWSSAGTSGFKGSRKSTPYAARLAGCGGGVGEQVGKEEQCGHHQSTCYSP